jgi:hypothetical protein
MQKPDLWQDGVAILKMETCCNQGFTLDKAVNVSVEYQRSDLKDLGKKIAKADDFSLTRDQWLAARSHNWEQIWLIPAILISVCFVVFLLLGRNPKEE